MSVDGDVREGSSPRWALPLALVAGAMVLIVVAAATGVFRSTPATPVSSTASARHRQRAEATGSPTTTAQGAASPTPTTGGGSPPTTSPAPAQSPPQTTGAATSPASGNGVLPGVVANCDAPAPTGEQTSVAPVSIVIACADDGMRLEDVNWTHWTGAGATGQGMFVANDCTPDCAQGTFHSYPATFDLSHPVRTPGGVVFAQLTVSYAHTGPAYPTGRLVTHFTLSIPRT